MRLIAIGGLEIMISKVFVVGHKNPDTDSICSAIAYANLKNKISNTECYVPKRAGEISNETMYALERFSVLPPDFIDDVGTQVKDIEIRKTEGVSSYISLKKAWTLMKDLKVATLPVTTNRLLDGLISVKDIATANMDIYDNTILATAKTCYRNILETLDGTMIVGDESAVIDSGKIIIATSNPDTLENYIDPGDLVILSNRYESQLCAIEMGACGIIICTGAPVSKTIKKLAEDKGCHIISTPYDTYITARLINQSTPIHYFMKTENLITFGVDDFTEDVKNIMAKVRHRDFPVLDDYGLYGGMISRRSLLDVKKKQVILVDHNEKSQAVDGLEHAEILEIIDHHRLGSMETIAPVFFRNQPVGCTATIIYQMYQESSVSIEPHIAGLLCAAIITDTLMFRSPTCTTADKTAAEDVARIANLDIKEFAEALFYAGSDLKGKSPEEILYQDFKKYSVGTLNFAVSQNNFMNKAELQEAKEMILSFLQKNHHSTGIDMLFMMLTNIFDESTELICYGHGAMELGQRAFHCRGEQETIHLPGVVSRKKQLIPAIMTELQQ